MRVSFKRNWFGPDGTRYRVRQNPHTIDDSLRDRLPSDAVVAEDDVVAEPVKAPAKPVKL